MTDDARPDRIAEGYRAFAEESAEESPARGRPSTAKPNRRPSWVSVATLPAASAFSHT